MVPAVEIMTGTARVRELIGDPQRTREIHDAISTGRDPYGMISFDQSLAELVRAKLVTYEEALRHSTTPDDFALVFRGVSGGGSAEGWQQEQMNKQNLAPHARPGTGAPTHADAVELEIERFSKE
jgi:twitching motility protein PilT